MATLNLGACPVIADIDDDSLTMSPASLGAVITSTTQAVICTAACGVPPSSEDLRLVMGARSRAVLIEDHAQAFGARIDGRAAGGAADLIALSFQKGKLLSCGAGGGVVSRCVEQIVAARQYLELGWHPRERDGAPDWQSGWRLREPLCQSGRLSDIAAALLLARLPEYDAARVERIEAVRRLKSALGSQLPWARQQQAPPGFDDHRWRVALICPSAAAAEELVLALGAKGSLAYRQAGPPPAEWPAFRERVSRGRASRTADLYTRMVLVPSGSVEDADREAGAVLCL